jgi:hypothetical protein
MKDGIQGYPQAHTAFIDANTLASRPLVTNEVILTDDLWESLEFVSRKGLCGSKVLAYNTFSNRWTLVDSVHATQIIFSDSKAMRDAIVDEAIFHGAIVIGHDETLTTLRQGAALLSVYCNSVE